MKHLIACLLVLACACGDDTAPGMDASFDGHGADGGLGDADARDGDSPDADSPDGDSPR